jgi:hypothetical protein
MCDVDLSAELEDMKNLLREKLSREAPVYEGKFNCLVYAMEKFLESNNRYLALEEKLENIEDKIEIIRANHEDG